MIYTANCPKKVDLIDEEGNVTETYESVGTSVCDLGISEQSIYNILRGKTKKTKAGYRFSDITEPISITDTEPEKSLPKTFTASEFLYKRIEKL